MDKIKCDNCNNDAEYNMQSNTKTYKIDDEQNFHLLDDELNDLFNDFYCDECYQRGR